MGIAGVSQSMQYGSGRGYNMVLILPTPRPEPWAALGVIEGLIALKTLPTQQRCSLGGHYYSLIS